MSVGYDRNIHYYNNHSIEYFYNQYPHKPEFPYSSQKCGFYNKQVEQDRYSLESPREYQNGRSREDSYKQEHACPHLGPSITIASRSPMLNIDHISDNDHTNDIYSDSSSSNRNHAYCLSPQTLQYSRGIRNERAVSYSGEFDYKYNMPSRNYQTDLLSYHPNNYILNRRSLKQIHYINNRLFEVFSTISGLLNLPVMNYRYLPGFESTFLKLNQYQYRGFLNIPVSVLNSMKEEFVNINRFLTYLIPLQEALNNGKISHKVDYKIKGQLLRRKDLIVCFKISCHRVISASIGCYIIQQRQTQPQSYAISGTGA